MNRLLLLFLAEILLCCIMSVAESNIASAEKEEKILATESSVKQKDNEDCEAEIPPDALAIVNGVIITRQEVEGQIKEPVFEIQQSLLDAREKELNLSINSRLLEQEARKRGIATSKLFEDEVLLKVKMPTEAEALSFYHKNKDQLQGEFDVLKKQIIHYLHRQRESLEAKNLAERLRSGATIDSIANYMTLTETDTDSECVLAVVNGEKIWLKDIDERLRPEIFKAQETIYELQKETVNRLINDLLLQQEAQKRNISTQELLNVEVNTKLKKIKKRDIWDFYQENKDRTDADYRNPVDRARITQYIKQQDELRTKSDFTERLRRAATIEVFLAAPGHLADAISIQDRPSKGREDAPVTIIEFVDYECSTCAGLHETLKELMEEYGNKVRLVACNFPLHRHARAYTAALAAEAAREQGKYWEYIDILFRNQTALEIEHLKAYASQLGLDRKKFDEALGTKKFTDKVKSDREDALRLGLNSTPTVFVNNHRVIEKTRESLKAAIETALRELVAQK